MRPRSFAAAAAFTAILFSGAALAQLDRFVIRGPAADKIEEKNEISLDTAKKVAAHCEEEARARGASASIAILDQFGEQVYFERMDGLRGHRQLDAAIMKAHAVIVTHEPSHVEVNRVQQGDQSEFHEGYYHDIFVASGGLPIVVDHQFIGAIGVGGSGFDELCAHNALQAVIGPQPPLTPNLPRRAGAGAG
jgi:glc operon protein GlcG